MAIRTGRTGTDETATSQTSPRAESDFVFAPVRIGPRFEWLDCDNIRILDGGLAGRDFRLVITLAHETAAVSLREQGVEVGNASVERDPPGQGIVLWDAGVREPLRANGLCSIMTWTLLRELLLHQDTASFRIRMVRALRADSGPAALQNVGMGVVALRLGFRPDPPMETTLAGRHVTGVRLIPPGPGYPPALQIDLDIDPLVIVAFVLNPDTMRPIQDYRYYTHLAEDRAMVLDCARRNLLAVSGNYCLRKAEVDHFVNRLAVDVLEAIRFRGIVRGF